MQFKGTMDELVKKLEQCFREAGLSPEVRTTNGSAIVAARAEVDEGPLRVIAQIHLGEQELPAGHGTVAKEGIARHLIDVAIRPTLGTQSAARSARPGLYSPKEK